MTKDTEKGNQLYYDEQHDQPCCTRCCGEFCQHPFTLLDVNGYVIDVKRTFAPSPIFLVLPLKLLALGITIDVMVRDIMNYGGVLSFYLAYFAHWTLIFSLLYFSLSSLLSIIPMGPQPSPHENRVPLLVCLAWSVYPLAIISQTLNFFAYWTLIYWDLGDIDTLIDRLSYFTLMKNFGILMMLIAEGQFVNRIPLRWSHLTIAELGFAGYIAWTMMHDATTLGNPDLPDGSDDDSIYSFLNWKNPDKLQESSLGSFITMFIIVPAVWFVYYVLSWPCRRYMPIEKEGDDDDEEDGSDDEDEEGGDEDDDDVEMANELTVPLMSGQPLGVKFATDFPPRIKSISDTSQLVSHGVVKGMVVDTLALQDGTIYHEMETSELVQHLKDTAHHEGRVLTLINPKVRPLTKKLDAPREPDSFQRVLQDDEIIVTLPAGSIGVVLNGKPPTVVRISEESTIGDQIREGLVVDTLMLEDGSIHYQLDSTELVHLLKEHSYSYGRVIRFINHDVLPLTVEPGTAAAPSVKEDDALVVSLPAGAIGLVFNKATPPMITKIKETSPLLYSGLQVGMCVDTLTLADTGEKFYQLDTKEFTTYLKQHRESEGGRVVRFIPEGMPVSTPPEEDEIVIPAEMPDEIELGLPPGPVGLLVEGTPPVITKMSDDSPLLGTGVVLGMVVDTLTLEDGTMLCEMESDEFKAALRENADSEERVIKLINPAAVELTKASAPIEEEPYVGPGEIECVVPPGSIRVAFIGQPPTITKIAPDSPVVEEGVVVGMMVDTVTIDDQVYYELDTPALTTLLTSNADNDNRQIRFVAPHYIVTPPPIPQQINVGSGSASVAAGSLAGRSVRSSVSRISRVSHAASVRSKKSSTVSVRSKKSVIEEELITEQDLEVKEGLLDMGFEEKTILDAIHYFKSIGEPVDADNCMTRIISES